MSDTDLVLFVLLALWVASSTVYAGRLALRVRGLEGRVEVLTGRVNDRDERIRLAEVAVKGVTGQFDHYDALIRDLTHRVACAEVAVAATPDVTAIITAATAPLVEMMGPRPIPQDTVTAVQQPADDEIRLDAFDPFDVEFPPPRATDDFTPPAAFGGIELPRMPET